MAITRRRFLSWLLGTAAILAKGGPQTARATMTAAPADETEGAVPAHGEGVSSFASKPTETAALPFQGQGATQSRNQEDAVPSSCKRFDSKEARQAREVDPKAPDVREVLINTFSVAGVQYYEGIKQLWRLSRGQELTLTPEPANPHDGYAVEIHADGMKLGYVPRSDNRHIFRLLQAGVSVRCRVAKVDSDETYWRMVRVEVFLSRDA